MEKGKWPDLTGLDVVLLLMAGLAVPKNLGGVGSGTRGGDLHPALLWNGWWRRELW